MMINRSIGCVLLWSNSTVLSSYVHLLTITSHIACKNKDSMKRSGIYRTSFQYDSLLHSRYIHWSSYSNTHLSLLFVISSLSKSMITLLSSMLCLLGLFRPCLYCSLCLYARTIHSVFTFVSLNRIAIRIYVSLIAIVSIQ